MKNALESYGRILGVAFMMGICLAILNFTMNSVAQPKLKTASSIELPSQIATQFEPIGYQGGPCEIDPLNLIDRESFPIEDYDYLKSTVATIFYQDQNHNIIVFKGRNVSGPKFDYNDVSYGNYHSFIDEITITTINKGIIIVKNAMVIIEEA